MGGVSFSSVRVVLYLPFLFNVVLKSQCTEKDDKIASLMRMQVSLEVEWTKSLQAFTTNSIESMELEYACERGDMEKGLTLKLNALKSRCTEKDEEIASLKKMQESLERDLASGWALC
jgi:hypothetical protein